MYHVHCLYFGGKLLLTPDVRLTGLFIVFAWRSLYLVFGIYLTGLFENPTISVGVVGRFVRAAMDLTRPIQYLV